MSQRKRLNVRLNESKNIDVRKGDNYIAIQASLRSGNVDEAILESDPDYEQKVMDILNKIETDQRAEIDKAHKESLSNYDDQIASLKDGVKELIN